MSGSAWKRAGAEDDGRLRFGAKALKWLERKLRKWMEDKCGEPPYEMTYDELQLVLPWLMERRCAT